MSQTTLYYYVYNFGTTKLSVTKLTTIEGKTAYEIPKQKDGPDAQVLAKKNLGIPWTSKNKIQTILAVDNQEKAVKTFIAFYENDCLWHKQKIDEHEKRIETLKQNMPKIEKKETAMTICNAIHMLIAAIKDDITTKKCHLNQMEEICDAIVTIVTLPGENAAHALVTKCGTTDKNVADGYIAQSVIDATGAMRVINDACKDYDIKPPFDHVNDRITVMKQSMSLMTELFKQDVDTLKEIRFGNIEPFTCVKHPENKEVSS